MEPWIWEKDRGTFLWSRDKLGRNPVCLFALQSQTCWYTVNCLRSWSCCTTKVLKTRKILINKYSGDEQKVWHYIFSHGKKNLCFIPRLKLHPCLMCFYQSLKHLTLLKWLSGKKGNLKKVPYLDLAPCSSVEGFFFDTNSIRNLVYHLKRKKVIFGSI